MKIFDEAAIATLPRYSSAQLVQVIQQQHIDSLKEELKFNCNIRHIDDEKPGVTNFRLQTSFRKMRIDTPYRLSIFSPPTCDYVEYLQEFEIQQIGEVQLGPLWQKTTHELMAKVNTINRFLEAKESKLKAVLTPSNCIKILLNFIYLPQGDELNNIALVVRQMNSTMLQFMMHFQHFHSVDLLRSLDGELFNEIETRQGQLMKKVKKVKQWIDFFGRSWILLQNQKEIFLKRAKKERDRFKELYSQEREPICNGIEIIEESKASASQIKIFQQNLQINGAMKVQGTLTIVTLNFQLYTTIHCRDYGNNNAFKTENINRETVIKKKCIQEVSHANELDFLIRAKDLKNAYIAKYFIESNKYQNGKTLVPIYSRFQGGDLYTDFLYPVKQKHKNHELDDYLLIFQQLAKFAQFMVRNGMLHRDLKLTNIILGYCNERIIIKVIDYGSWVSASHSKSQINQRDEKIIKNIQKKRELRRTINYSLTYNEAIQKDSSLQQKISQKDYEIHNNFDIYSIGFTMKKLVQQTGVSDNPLNHIIESCLHPNPNLRPNPTELGYKIVDLRVFNYLMNNYVPTILLEKTNLT